MSEIRYGQHCTARIAADIVKNYRCSTCFGHLVEDIDPEDSRMSWVYCPREALDECAGGGFWTARFVDSWLAQSIADRWDATDNLKEVVEEHNSSKGKSVEQLLTELGF